MLVKLILISASFTQCKLSYSSPVAVQWRDVLRIFLGVRHQLGAEVADGKEVVSPSNQLSVFVIKNWQTAESQVEILVKMLDIYILIIL